MNIRFTVHYHRDIGIFIIFHKNIILPFIKYNITVDNYFYISEYNLSRLNIIFISYMNDVRTFEHQVTKGRR